MNQKRRFSSRDGYKCNLKTLDGHNPTSRLLLSDFPKHVGSGRVVGINAT